MPPNPRMQPTASLFKGIVRSPAEAPLADLGDAREILAYLVGFWAFLLSPRYRARTLHTWRHADRTQRSWMMLDGVVATLVGVGLPLLIAWLLAKKLLAR